ncbi:DUF1611 domain-containing protein [Ruegeria sp. 2205SS24-7]|uniref:DUF1611 domain-containing protein n=1 Tax=Ruegeria discodermiae TaxID=3064389 RepID=UPI0027428CD7|nr:DUF1611 domain-containing protein [Ruegeria sp. 2205SS24-7]MDP5220946.1 DUF1611 domain-containing protein [Ruegeria sp. 2205SS24-7]
MLVNVSNGVPILEDIEAAVTREASVPDTLVHEMASSTGELPKEDREVVLEAIALGMNIINAPLEYLGDDLETSSAADSAKVKIRDIRKPRPSKDLRLFDGSVSNVKAIRIAVLGTDCAIGKRARATAQAKALSARVIKTVLVGTGLTGLDAGRKHGIAMDAVPQQFCRGEIERAIVAAAYAENLDVIQIEGQGALSHPAFCISAFILRDTQSQGIILQNAPKGPHRCDFPTSPMPDPKSEFAVIKSFADTRLVGLATNHEAITDAEGGLAIDTLSRNIGVPVTNAWTRSDVHLDDFPQLRPVPLVAAA